MRHAGLSESAYDRARKRLLYLSRCLTPDLPRRRLRDTLARARNALK